MTPGESTAIRRGASIALLSLLAAVALCACTPPSLLVPEHDPVFERAQRRLDSTEAYVDAQSATPEDRRVFLQAESFYRYRYSFPPRSFVGYLAEGAAAVTDFPALQSFASSLDLADLRLSSTDASIQLWETLLARSPSTPLRPLALYRLGWAYRYTAVRGFPRRSGDAAFDALAKEFPGSELVPFAVEAKGIRWKSRSKATALSLLPGGGQFYEQRYGSGTIRLSVGIASAALVAAPAWVAYQRRSDLQWNRDWPLLTAGIAGAAILSIDYTSSYQDAAQGAVRFNEREEEKFEEAHPGIP